MIVLSKRLQSILDSVQGECLADIGCDHAYIAAEAVLQNKVMKAYACDIAEGPLERAKETIQSCHLSHRVQCLLMNGIENLPSEVDTVVIAGMGAQTVVSILENGKSFISTQMEFIVSVHKDAECLRDYLSNHNFQIEYEKIIKEGNHFYPILCIKPTLLPCEPLTQVEIFYGKNVDNRQGVWTEYLNHEYIKWNKIAERISTNKKTEMEKRLDILKKLLRKS